MNNTPDLSIIVPCYNEESSIDHFLNTISSLSPTLPHFEVVFVDDGSTDMTYLKILNYKSKLSPFGIKVIQLSRNFGHQRALLAGLTHSLGKACISIDVDLQDPPELILKMVELWKNGADIVVGQREDRTSDSWFKRTSATFFYKLMSTFTQGAFLPHVADFRLLDKKVVEHLLKIQDFNPYWRGLVAWVGFKTSVLRYARTKRQHGTSKYPVYKMLALALDGIFSFSKLPLQIASILGFIVSFGSFLFAAAYFVLRLFNYKQLLPGWTAIFFAVTFLGGLQLVCLGILGQYVGRIFEQVQGRPRFIAAPPEVVCLAQSREPQLTRRTG